MVVNLRLGNDFKAVSVISAALAFTGSWGYLAAVQGLFVASRIATVVAADADLTLYRSQLKPKYFEGKVVWITGASSGIGEFLAYELSKCGAKLILSARNLQELERVRSGCAGGEKNTKVLRMDVLEVEIIASKVQEATRLFGQIDVLVNNAGRSQRSAAEDTPAIVDSQIMQINYNSVVHLTKAVLPSMIERKSGHIVNTSSVAGVMGSPCASGYAGAKHALQGFMDSLRMEVCDRGITITNVCPGPVQSNISRSSFTSEVGQALNSNDAAEKARMPTTRCAQLYATAISQQLDEAWISPQPVLLFTYMSQFLPDLTFEMQKIVGNKKARQFRESSDNERLNSIHTGWWSAIIGAFKASKSD